ncbi:MAG: hypothetical protein ACRENN_04135, partial [Candidatus Eiseniibacteriota bacterium]
MNHSPDGRDTDHAHAALELASVLTAIAGRTRSLPGREVVTSLAPHARIEGARLAQALYADLLALENAGDAPPAAAPPDLRAELSRLGMEGAVLRGDELWRIAALLSQAGSVTAWHRKTTRYIPGLAALLDNLDPLDPLHRDLVRSLEPTGEVKDEASPELARIRRAIRTLQTRLAGKLESTLRSLSSPESFVSLREGRYVIAIPSGQRRALPGTVVGHSGSGASVFVEPKDVADGNSELAEMAVDEAREVERVLRELSDR